MTLARRGVRLFRHSVKAGFALVGLWCAVIVTASALWVLSGHAYERAQERLRIQARTYVHLIAAQYRISFTVADVLMQDLSDQLSWSDLNGDMSAARRAQVQALLRRHAERLPGIASFTVIGADGVRRAGLVGPDFTDLGRRSYFLALKTGEQTYVSSLEEGLASGKAGIHVARRYNGPNGEFGGAVVINLAMQDVFYPSYRRLRLGPEAITTLQDPTKQLFAFPPQGASALTAVARRAIAQMERDRQRRALLVETTDGVERLTALERLEGSHLIATVSLPVADALAGAREVTWTALFGALASALSGIAATLVIVRIRLVAKARDQAVKSDADKRRLIQKVNAAIEDERKSIAVEIHDDLNATVLSVRLDSQRILSLVSQPLSEQAIAEIRQRAESTIGVTRELYARGRAIVTRLRPEVLDTLGLKGAVEEMVIHLDETDPSCRFAFFASGDFSTLDGAVAIAAYRIAQEALSNVVKHARATRVEVSVAVSEDAQSLRLSVIDDGAGFEPASPHGGIGVIGMSERVFAFRGTINVRSVPGEGTRVLVELPLRESGVT